MEGKESKSIVEVKRKEIESGYCGFDQIGSCKWMRKALD